MIRERGLFVASAGATQARAGAAKHFIGNRVSK